MQWWRSRAVSRKGGAAGRGRKENKETENQAIARKQEPFPVSTVMLWLALFGAVSACLYAYLNYVLADDDDDDVR